MKGISDICTRHPDLTSIGLQHNMINSVGKDDFMGCYELEEVDVSHNNIAIIDQESFTGLTKLKKLKLLGNYIICFDKKFLMKFEYVPVIEIDLRFFECNCESKWMSEWWDSSSGDSMSNILFISKDQQEAFPGFKF